MKHAHMILAVVLAIAVSGCFASKPITVPPLTEADIAGMTAAANFPHEGYRLEPGDAIQIRYLHHPEMSQDDVIPADYRINIKLVGEIDVAGMTTEDIEQLLVKKTSEHLKNPEVVVSVIRFTEKLIYVGGEVGRPGTLLYRKGLTPLQAVAASGGFRDTARTNSVILLRVGASDHNLMARKLNLDQVMFDGVRDPISLAPRDVLFVPRTEVADANIWVRQYIGDMVPFFRGVGVNAGYNVNTGGF
jgi:protein involved in polysaccharide export with SLBB domain